MKHLNSGDCPYCNAIFDRYEGFYAPLRSWFKEFQKRHPEAHISCAGRGRVEQEALFMRKATRATYGKSAHNFNCAIDIFEYSGDIKNIYESEWFHKILAPQLPIDFYWFGSPGSPFHEFPHVQLATWKLLASRGELKLVEL